MENGKPAPISEARRATRSRRDALALMLGAASGLPRRLAASNAGEEIRLAISESVVGDVNLSDARAAMQIWIKRITQDLNVVISPALFDTTQEILRRTRRGQLDAVALNAIEYRQIADMLDPSEIVTSAGAAGLEQYVILAKRNNGIGRLSDLKRGRLCILKSPKMCVAEAWLSTLLFEGNLGAIEQFFGSTIADTKFSRVILPVFFGQAEACLTSRRGFETMSELNPQVAKDLQPLASSPLMVVSFYIFCKNFPSAQRQKLIRAISTLRESAAGMQLATLFQFDQLIVRDASSLESVLNVLEKADRAAGRRSAGGGRLRK